jgi:leucyl-tRNA synthetase
VYYRWTQWIFLELYKAGLAYRKKANVNWCPSCKTVLANEQAKGDVCERCGASVIDREMEQWFFRITDYADRLLAGLDTLDWSEITKQAQRYWIGKSDGAVIDFEIDGFEAPISVFTTRPDTLYGVTFLAISPDHRLATVLTGLDEAKIAEMFEEASHCEESTFGINTKRSATHPLTGKPVPIWIVDYVISDYGSAAIMGVPAHDERDFGFARSHNIAIVRVIASKDNPSRKENSDRNIADQDLPFTEFGVLVASDQFNGLESAAAMKAIIDYLEDRNAGRTSTSYRLRDWCVSRQRYWGTPIPMIHCDSCGVVPVPEHELPVRLPFIEKYHPDGSGKAPLAREESFTRTTCPSCGGVARRETDVCDNFLDSAWYFLRYPSSDDSSRPFRHDRTTTWLPVDMYIGGNEHAVLHLMYSRFVTMALHDAGHVEFEEPFIRFRANGLIIKDGAKMSKSKGNVINPDDYILRFGADVFRTYLMFFGNYVEGGDFRDENITGIERFLDRVWKFASEHEMSESPMSTALASDVHRRIRKVTRDIEALRYNTAIASCMELYQLLATAVPCPKSAYLTLLQLLAPFAPFLTQELWSRAGRSGYISAAPWPEYDEQLIDDRKVEFVVQINGKVRDRFTTDAFINEEDATQLAGKRPKLSVHLEGKRVKKTIFVPGKLLNIVVE